MVIRNRAVQAPVMINPTGKIPNVRPGMTKVVPALESGPDEAACGADANIPLTKDVSLAERFVVREVPSPLVAERVMIGARSERLASLFHS